MNPADSGPWFDPAWYLLRNPGVAAAGTDPAVHYRDFGEAEGRQPSPWFDPVWYRQAHDVAPDQLALEHFLAHRADGQFAPHPDLWCVPFLPPWRGQPDPFGAYLGAMAKPGHELLPALDLIRGSGLIGGRYHALNASDPFEAALDPAIHYLRIGSRFGARPNDAFDPAWYRRTNRAAARARVDPLVHYLAVGERAGRRPVPWFDPVWYRTEYAAPRDQSALGHYLAHRTGGTVSPNALFDPAWYVARHGVTLPPGIDPFAHYQLSAATGDVSPSPRFDARLWRHRNMPPLGAPGQDRLAHAARDPLSVYLDRTYAVE